MIFKGNDSFVAFGLDEWERGYVTDLKKIFFVFFVLRSALCDQAITVTTRTFF